MYKKNYSLSKHSKFKQSALPNHHPVRICILGGGLGGLYTALELEKFTQVTKPNYEVLLVEKREHFLLTPLLYEVVT
jgi:NADH dehydrogenase